MAVIFTPARAAVILHTCWQSTSPFPIQRSSFITSCWRSYSPLLVQRSSFTPPADVHIHLCTNCGQPSWRRSYSPLHALRSSSTSPNGSHFHPSPPNGHPLSPPDGGHINPSIIPPYPQINTNPEANLTVPDLTISLYGSSCNSPFFSVADPELGKFKAGSGIHNTSLYCTCRTVV